MKDFYCVKNNTWCIDTGRTLAGVYRLNDNDVVLLDTTMSYVCLLYTSLPHTERTYRFCG